MSRLRRGGIEVVWLRGNHDAKTTITRHLRMPDGVIELDTKKPETRVFEELGVAVHGQGFDKASVTDDLSQNYPEPLQGLFNIGLLHTAVGGRPGHAPYAPCRLQDLVNHGYQYWALGHVHQREVLHRDPWVVFSGNLQGRHVGECGPKGASMVSVENRAVTEVEHRAVDVVRWAVCEVNVTGVSSLDEVEELARDKLAAESEAAGERLLAARVVVTGSSLLHRQLRVQHSQLLANLRLFANDLGQEAIWLEQAIVKTTPLEGSAGFKGSDAAEFVVQALKELRAEPLKARGAH